MVLAVLFISLHFSLGLRGGGEKREGRGGGKKSSREGKKKGRGWIPPAYCLLTFKRQKNESGQKKKRRRGKTQRERGGGKGENSTYA